MSAALASAAIWCLLASALLAIAGAASRALLNNPRGDVETGLAWWFVRFYVRLVHRVRYQGLENVPRWRPGEPPVGPLVIVANHTAGVDPVLIHAAISFDVSWMMLRVMMLPWAAPLWSFCGVIPVGPGDSAAAREAIRVLKRQGVIGIFPEGNIERPPRMIMPFEPGVGLIIHRSGARVLMVTVEGTPTRVSAFASLFTPSRARVRFFPIISYDPAVFSAAAIARDLQDRMLQATNWPFNRAGVSEELR